MEIPRLSRIEEVILRLLVTEEMYGLQMVKASDKLKRGTIYVTLHRMEEKGFVESRVMEEDAGSDLPRRIYRVTGLGERVLRATEQAAAAFAAEFAT